MLDLWLFPVVVVAGLVILGLYLALGGRDEGEQKSPLQLAQEEERREAQALRIQRKLAKSHR